MCTVPVFRSKPNEVVAGDAKGMGDLVCAKPCATSATLPLTEHLTSDRCTQPGRWAVAGVAKLVDATDLGSVAARRGGSSPLTRTSTPSTPALATIELDGLLNAGHRNPQ